MPTALLTSLRTATRLTAVRLTACSALTAATLALGALTTATVSLLPQRAEAQFVQYTVKKGDTLWGIAQSNGVKVPELLAVNQLQSADRIQVGQKLLVPSNSAPVGAGLPLPPAPSGAAFPPGLAPVTPAASSGLPPLPPAGAGNGGAFDPYSFTQSVNATANPPSVTASGSVMHTVKIGESLLQIAQQYGVSPRAIIQENRLPIPVVIYQDQALFIPGLRAVPVTSPSAPAAPSTSIASRPLPAAPSLPTAALPSLTDGRGQPSNGIISVPLPSPGRKPAAPAATRPAQSTASAPTPPAAPATPRATTTTTTTTVASPAAPAAPATTTTTTTTVRPANSTQTASAAPATGSSNGTLLNDPLPAREDKFVWPVRGRLLSEFGTKEGGLVNDGINIAASDGTEIAAAADGVVAYAGDKLKGFGNLLLVRHAGGWVTAYAHNSELMVKKGDRVTAGQVVAKAGQTGSVNRPQLHFEVRKDGRALNPLRYLAN